MKTIREILKANPETSNRIDAIIACGKLELGDEQEWNDKTNELWEQLNSLSRRRSRYTRYSGWKDICDGFDTLRMIWTFDYGQ